MPLTAQDVGSESKELMRSLHRIVDDLEPQYRAAIDTRRGGLVLLKNGEQARWIERVRGVDLIEVFSEGKRIGSFPLAESLQPREVDLRSLGLKGNWRDQPVLLVGRSKGEPVFRVVRELKWRGSYVAIPEQGTTTTFAEEDPGPVKTVLLHGPADSGWQVTGGILRVGRGPKYSSSVHARAFLPLQLNGNGGVVSFDIKLEAEDPYDSLRIFLVNPDSGELRHFFAGSNVPAASGVQLKLPLGWERADLVFEFESDENWNLAGPLLDNFEISRVSR